MHTCICLQVALSVEGQPCASWSALTGWVLQHLLPSTGEGLGGGGLQSAKAVDMGHCTRYRNLQSALLHATRMNSGL